MPKLLQDPGSVQLKAWMYRARFETQRELAGFLGMDERFVSLYLNGRMNPGLKVALYLERKTGIPVEAWALSELDDLDVAGIGGSAKSQI